MVKKMTTNVIHNRRPKCNSLMRLEPNRETTLLKSDAIHSVPLAILMRNPHQYKRCSRSCSQHLVQQRPDVRQHVYGYMLVCIFLFNCFYFSPNKASYEVERSDDEHRLIARYTARLAADANSAVSYI